VRHSGGVRYLVVDGVTYILLKSSSITLNPFKCSSTYLRPRKYRHQCDHPLYGRVWPCLSCSHSTSLSITHHRYARRLTTVVAVPNKTTNIIH